MTDLLRTVARVCRYHAGVIVTENAHGITVTIGRTAAGEGEIGRVGLAGHLIYEMRTAGLPLTLGPDCYSVSSDGWRTVADVDGVRLTVVVARGTAARAGVA